MQHVIILHRVLASLMTGLQPFYQLAICYRIFLDLLMSFRGLADLVFVGININYLCSSYSSSSALAGFLDLGGGPVDSITIPLGITVSGNLVRLPVALAEPEERVFSLQDVDDAVLDAERCVSPHGWGLAVLEQSLKECLGHLAYVPFHFFRDLSSILVLHIT